MTDLTVVMYHYVRPIRESRFPRIKGLELLGFRKQLDYIGQRFNVVSALDVVRAERELIPLPENPILLTFDDGYRDHAQFVFPELVKRGWTGVFFPPSRAVEKREILDVNKIHYILASIDNPENIIRHIESAIEEESTHEPVRKLADLRSELLVASRFDPAEVNYVKCLLQYALPFCLRTRLSGELFLKYVSNDPESFSEEIYLHPEDLITMAEGGMEIGSHGSRHLWMNHSTRAEQERDLDESLEFLSRLGVADLRQFFYCYPFGGYDTTTLALLRERRCAAAFTTRPEIFRLRPGAPLLEISRFDTNDIPAQT